MNQMFVVAFAVVACMAAFATASGPGPYGGPGPFYGGYGYDAYNKDGFRRVPNGIAAAYKNDERQVYVNRVAEHVGASSGTARYYGVPGTNRDFGYGYRHGYGHPAAGYGYGEGYGFGAGYGGYY